LGSISNPAKSAVQLRNDVLGEGLLHQGVVAMPRYYFHVHNRERLTDPDGTVLSGKKSAVIHALGVARELMFKRSGMRGQPWSAWTMRVKDKNGKTIHTLPFAEVPDSETKH
jgi:hypothetical protein